MGLGLQPDGMVAAIAAELSCYVEALHVVAGFVHECRPVPIGGRIRFLTGIPDFKSSLRIGQGDPFPRFVVFSQQANDDQCTGNWHIALIQNVSPNGKIGTGFRQLPLRRSGQAYSCQKKSG